MDELSNRFVCSDKKPQKRRRIIKFLKSPGIEVGRFSKQETMRGYVKYLRVILKTEYFTLFMSSTSLMSKKEWPKELLDDRDVKTVSNLKRIG